MSNKINLASLQNEDRKSNRSMSEGSPLILVLAIKRRVEELGKQKNIIFVGVRRLGIEATGECPSRARMAAHDGQTARAQGHAGLVPSARACSRRGGATPKNATGGRIGLVVEVPRLGRDPQLEL